MSRPGRAERGSAPGFGTALAACLVLVLLVAGPGLAGWRR